MVAFVIQVNTPSDSSTEQVKVASSPGQTQRVSGESDPFTASEKGTRYTHLAYTILYIDE